MVEALLHRFRYSSVPPELGQFGEQIGFIQSLVVADPRDVVGGGSGRFRVRYLLFPALQGALESFARAAAHDCVQRFGTLFTGLAQMALSASPSWFSARRAMPSSRVATVLKRDEMRSMVGRGRPRRVVLSNCRAENDTK